MGPFTEHWTKLAELVADCPAVEVSSTPPGASIQLVGVPQAEGSVTPWHGRLVAGDYAVVLHKPGFQDLRAVLKVVRDAPASQAFTLTPVQPPLAASPPPPVDLKAPVDLTAPPPADDKLAAAAVHPPAKPLKVVGWVGTAVGGAALVTGIALGASVASDKTALTKASSSRTTAEANAQVQSINSRALGANVLFGVGGAIAVVGVVLTFAF